MKDFSIILAADSERGIGKDGKLAWNIPEDMKNFKKITSETQGPNKRNAVVMGRKTWESLPEKFRPLPGRLNCILSSKYGNEPEKIDENTYAFGDFDACKSFLSAREDIENIYIIGGSYLYNLVLDDPHLKYIYLTRVYDAFECDVFFSPIPYNFYEIEKSEKKSHKGLDYQFFTYGRQKSYKEKYFGFLFSKK